jgi:hypothetical protein
MDVHLYSSEEDDDYQCLVAFDVPTKKKIEILNIKDETFKQYIKYTDTLS